MRKEIYELLCERLKTVGNGAIKYIDLWNHNVEYIEQEEGWERPAVFVEFEPVKWMVINRGEEYKADVTVNLHVVTDWAGSSSADSVFRSESLAVFDLLEEIHAALTGLSGETFERLDIVSSTTNHNHEDIVENIESYRCVGRRRLIGGDED